MNVMLASCLAHKTLALNSLDQSEIEPHGQIKAAGFA